MKKLLKRLLAAFLAAALLSTPTFGLTPEQALHLLELYYIDPLPQRVAEASTVAEMLSALGDRFTQYFTAAQYEAFLRSMQDSAVVGIGVELESRAQGLEILKVLDGSPAQELGLRRGDCITAVDGVSLAGMPFTDARGLIAGVEGSQVTLSLLREGESLDVTLTRREFLIPATETELVDGHVAYITCSTFGEETRGHFEAGITALDAAANVFVVDLRGNGGGDVRAAIESAGAFTGEADLTYLRDRRGNYQVYRPESAALTMDPVIVLTNGGTASASEIFASVVRDLGEGIVIGERTYGKGVAQVLLDGAILPGYFEEGDALKITAYRYYSPLGTSADRVGILPHLLVEEDYAPQVALLLSAPAPKSGTLGMLRVDLKWRWYVDLEEASLQENAPAFRQLLEALPADTPLWLGTGGDLESGWRETSAAEVARLCSVEGYAPRVFSDLAESPWRGEIELLHTYGLVRGVGDGTFLPQATLTRAQLCVMLANAMGYLPTAPQAVYFDDVPLGMWYTDGVNAMYEMGLVKGWDDGLFHPDEPVDHQQMLTIVGRVASGLSMSFLSSRQAGMGEAEADYASWDGWAREYVWLLDGSQIGPTGELSLLWQKASQVDPLALSTREEAAFLLCSLLSYTNILPG